MISRRQLLSGAAAGALALTTAGCITATDVTNATTQWTTFVDQVTALVAAGCAIGTPFIPTVQTIAEIVASLYGPGAQATVGAINGAVTVVAKDLCAAAQSTGVTHSARFRASTAELPVYIGTSPATGVQVIGYAVANATPAMKARISAQFRPRHHRHYAKKHH